LSVNEIVRTGEEGLAASLWSSRRLGQRSQLLAAEHPEPDAGRTYLPNRTHQWIAPRMHLDQVLG
jgi:hypothetical protein